MIEKKKVRMKESAGHAYLMPCWGLCTFTRGSQL